MIIEKVLNNNVVVIKNEHDIEQIVMGRGIAYKKKPGDPVDESLVNKVFKLSDQDVVSKLEELIIHIPIEYIQLGEEIVELAKSNLSIELNDLIYVNLVDHIFNAVSRVSEGFNLKNFQLWDIKRFYKNEYAVGLKALDLIEKRLNVRLTDDEAGFITLHIVNSTLRDDRVQDVSEITNIMQEITNIVKYEFNFNFDEESVYFYRFITHLKFFAQRLVSERTHGVGNEDDLLEVVMIKYRNSFSCVLKIVDFIKEKYDYEISDEERVYLTIHIERVVYKN